MRTPFLFLGAVALLAGSPAATAAHAATRADCDAGAFEQVLRPAPQAFDARAVWLDGQRLVWPGKRQDSAFKLYHSPQGAIAAPVGQRVQGHAGVMALAAASTPVPARFAWVDPGAIVETVQIGPDDLRALHASQLVLVEEDSEGMVRDATRIQVAGAFDDLFHPALDAQLGVQVEAKAARFALWAPSAQHVHVCTYASGSGRALGIDEMTLDRASGVWRASKAGAWSGKYYRYLVDVIVDGKGLVRNRVTDPYSVSLTTDSKRSLIADLASTELKPAGWDTHKSPATVAAPTDMAIYELHVRDFSINDPSVPAPLRGKYGAFGVTGSHGMRHLAALAKAGMTDIHLLPIFDFGSVPERRCATPRPAGTPNGLTQQAAIAAVRARDCFNWGYDPYHFNAPEGSYASDPADGRRRVLEVRQMIQALHAAGLRVGMDVVYNHTHHGGQKETSVLDRIVPGYYHRLDGSGAITISTCCDNTATENAMMAKLMIDSAVLWTREYRIDSFRFDLMGHQPRAAMETLQQQVNAAAGKTVHLLGEGWNFGEVADGKRFVQASQLSLGGSGIGSFSDRARDAIRGGRVADSGAELAGAQGFINGLVYDPNDSAGERPVADLLQAGDMVKVGLAGSLQAYPLQLHTGETRRLERIVYTGQPAGYAVEPVEAVNYVENHDNHTLFDANALKLPQHLDSAERARVQVLGVALNAFSQGIAYFHAGIDTLRSKSLDRNSFESGDWFNRIDWTYRDNYFGSGLPPAWDNRKDYPLMTSVLANPAIKPRAQDIAFTRDAFRDLLAIRASSTLLRMRTSADVLARLRFLNTGPDQVPGVVAAHVDGAGYPGAGFASLTYLVNADKVARSIPAPSLQGRTLRLHPVHRAPAAADQRAATASFDAARGSFTIPARTAVVFVE